MLALGPLRPRRMTKHGDVMIKTKFAHAVYRSGALHRLGLWFWGKCIMSDRARIAIECHRFAAARFARTGADDDYQLLAGAFSRLATIAETSAGAAAVAGYVACLPAGDLPRGWLQRFVLNIATRSPAAFG
jgi:hypothetical protein